jgi:hypothetical protein
MMGREEGVVNGIEGSSDESSSDLRGSKKAQLEGEALPI